MWACCGLATARLGVGTHVVGSGGIGALGRGEWGRWLLLGGNGGCCVWGLARRLARGA